MADEATRPGTKIDHEETRLMLAHHQPDGEVYLLQGAALWTEDGQRPAGSTIIACAGPLSWTTWTAQPGSDAPRADWPVWAEALLGKTAGVELQIAADWANKEDEEGRWALIACQPI